MASRETAVELYFTDREGVRWRVYQFGIVAGRPVEYPVGSMQGDYRSFVRPGDGGGRVKRRHAMFRETAEERALTAFQLQRQLDASVAR